MNKLSEFHTRRTKSVRVISKVISLLLSIILVIHNIPVYNMQKVNAEYTEDSQPPTAPVNFTVTPVSGSAITFKTTEHTKDIVASVSGSAIAFVWDASTDNVGVEGYEIFCENNPVGKTTVTNYTYSDVNGPSSKQFYVFAYDRAGNISDQSNKVNVIFDPEAIIKDKQEPTIPANVIAVPNPEGSVTLSWDASVDNVGIEGYEIYKNGVIIGFTKDTSFTDTEYDPEANDIYCIAAYDLAGNRSQESEPAYLTQESNELEGLFNKTDRFIIKYKNKAGSNNFRQSMKNSIKSSHTIISYKNENIEVVYLNYKVKPEEFIRSIIDKRSSKTSLFDYASDIEYIQPDYQFSAASADPCFDQQWGIKNNTEDLINYNTDALSGNLSPEEVIYKSAYSVDADVTDAWKLTKGSGTIVAVLDTGIDITHEGLADNIWTNRKEIPGNNIDDDGNGFIDDIHGWNFADYNNLVHNQANINDEWHGTHIAGIIAAKGDNNVGITGVAPDAMVMPLKVFNNGIAYTSDIIAAIKYAEQMGVKIVNCSWGSTEYNQALKETIDNSGMLFVCAAGNQHINTDTLPVYPAAYDSHNIISAASVNSQGILSSFTNYGEVSVDIAAPGENILSTGPDNTYISSSGTSMAAAFVSGEAALILSIYKDLDAAGTKDRIIATSDRLSSLIGKIFRGNKISCSNAIHSLVSDEIIQIKAIDTNNYQINDYINQDYYALYTSGSWMTKANLPVPVSGLKAVTLYGKIYAIGGDNSNKVFQYDPETNQWTQKASMLHARSEHTVVNANGKIYAIGGVNGSGFLNSIEEYNPTTDSWVLKANMPTARAGICAAAINNLIYVMGGYNGSNLNLVQVFNTATNTWSAKAGMINARRSPSAAVIGDKIYVAGGINSSTMEMYDPSSNSWSIKSGLPAARGNFGLEAVNGKLYAIGGYSTGLLNGADEYSPVTNSWSSCPALPAARGYHGTASINNMIYVIGGRNAQGDTSLVECLALGEVYDDYVNDYGNSMATAQPIVEETEISGIIGYAGDEDYFSFVASSSAVYNIYTLGITDTYGYVLSSDGSILAANGDDYNYCNWLNFYISVSLVSGRTYYVRVRHSNSQGTGGYKLRVSKHVAMPTGISFTTSHNSITASWDGLPYATGYEIYVANTNTIYNCGYNPYFVHSGLQSGTAYAYQMRVKINTYTSPWSSVYYASTKGTGSWEIISNLPAETTQNLYITGFDNKLYAFNSQYSSFVINEYNIDENRWKIRLKVSAGSSVGGVAAVNNKIYIFMGNSSTFMVYDPVTNSVITKTGMHSPRDMYGITVYQNKIYIVGGYDGTMYSNVDVYDPATDSWAVKTPMPTARGSLALAVVKDKLYAIGGMIHGQYITTVEEYNPQTNIWTRKADMPTRRDDLVAAEINGKIYAMGGKSNDMGVMNIVEIYTPETNTWTTGDSKLLRGAHSSIAVVNGTVYIMGGFGDYGEITAVEVFRIAQPLEYIYDENNCLKEIKRGGKTIAVMLYDKNGNLLKIQTIP